MVLSSISSIRGIAPEISVVVIEKMDIDSEHPSGLEATASHWIHVVGTCIEIFGVFIIVAGIIWSSFLYVHRRQENGTMINIKSASADRYCLASKYWSLLISSRQ
jgi:hypothetical protein